jgi:hypothetical protein
VAELTKTDTKAFPVAYFNRGNAYNNHGLDYQAIIDYTMAISLNPRLESTTKIEATIICTRHFTTWPSQILAR